MKSVREYGTVEKRPNGRYRVRIGKKHGATTLGTYDSKTEAEDALQSFVKEQNIEETKYKNIPSDTAEKPWASIGLDGGEIGTGVLTEPLGSDWSAILLSFGLDPDVFEVADDKVRMSKWQSSKRLENGDRDLIWLYSYRATFTRKKGSWVTKADIDEIRKSIRKFKPTKTTIKSKELPSTFVVLWADWQLYKSAAGGIKASTERVLASFDATAKRIQDLQKLGRNIEQIAFVNMGDVTESCDGHYASQLFSVQGTQRQQLLTALDLWTTGVVSLADFAKKRKFISTLSNHGEWQRRGGKQITTDSDNADGFLSDALQRIMQGYGLIDDWHVPHDQMSMQVNLSGVECAFTHGHKITGKEFEWLRGQTLRLLRDNKVEPTVWFTAHKHHLKVDDFGVFTRFQCPSLDSDFSTNGGSKWFTDMSGQFSAPGTLSLLIGRHDPKCWSDMAVL